MISVTLAAIAALLFVGHGWLTSGIFILLATFAAIIGEYGHSLVVVTTRFNIFLTIFINMFGNTQYREELLFSIIAGAIGTSSLSLVLGGSVHRCIVASIDAAMKETISQKITRWWKSLAHLSGWQYTLRLTFCLCIAEALRFLCPNHHFFLIALTITILIQRKIEPIPIKTTQRVLGTVLGVIATSLLLANRLPVWGLVISIGLLAGLRPLLKVRNYLVYSASMIPLIILIMEAGNPFKFSILIDRLIATLIGAGLVIVINLVFSRMMTKTS